MLVSMRQVTQIQGEWLSASRPGRVELSTHSAGVSVQLWQTIYGIVLCLSGNLCSFHHAPRIFQ